MENRYGAPPPPPPPSSMPMGHEYGRPPMRSPPGRYRSPSPRRYRSRSPRPAYEQVSHGRYRSRSPPRYRSRSPPRRQFEQKRRAPAPVYRGTEEERARSTTLFIGNIPYGFEERDVAGLFERFGRLRQVYVPLDRFTRRNKGFAFVSFEQRLDAEDASFKYNGYTIEGRKLRIDWDVGIEKKDHLKPRSPPPTRYPASPPRREYPPGSPRREYETSPPPPRARDYPPASPPPRHDDYPPRRDRSPPPAAYSNY